MGAEDVKVFVRKRYGEIAKGNACCGATCGEPVAASGDPKVVAAMSKAIGYTEADLVAAPEGANLGLGCGNPVALAALKEGQVVLDLGSGAGFDCFLAASRVGARGRVIGVDMTPEMLAKARENTAKGKYENVEFRLGEIENLPVADGEVDVVISNCVINLSPDKERVFREAFRVLKPGGMLAVSDMVLLRELPEAIRNSVEMYVGCVAGALLRGDYLAAVRAAGFTDVKVVDETPYPVESLVDDPAVVEEVTASAASVKVTAVKPG